mgnify:CR=1 FL=1
MFFNIRWEINSIKNCPIYFLWKFFKMSHFWFNFTKKLCDEKFIISILFFGSPGHIYINFNKFYTCSLCNKCYKLSSMFIFHTIVYIYLCTPKIHIFIHTRKQCKWIIIMCNVKILAELKLNIMYIYCLGLAWLITKKNQNHEIGK